MPVIILQVIANHQANLVLHIIPETKEQVIAEKTQQITHTRVRQMIIAEVIADQAKAIQLQELTKVLVLVQLHRHVVAAIVIVHLLDHRKAKAAAVEVHHAVVQVTQAVLVQVQAQAPAIVAVLLRAVRAQVVAHHQEVVPVVAEEEDNFLLMSKI